jgi:TPR repeat protein
MGGKHYIVGDYDKAVEYYTKAAELGDSMAHHSGCMYSEGKSVEKDKEMAIRHWEKAAIGGNHLARYNLYIHETDNKRAVKHLIIAAKLGDEKSMKKLWEYYPDGLVSKSELDATLRAHHSAIDATKSADRDAAEACHQR